jgi:hypothetical protein
MAEDLVVDICILFVHGQIRFVDKNKLIVRNFCIMLNCRVLVNRCRLRQAGQANPKGALKSCKK